MAQKILHNTEHLQEEIAHESVEGRPAHPEFGGKAIGGLAIAAGVGLLIAAVVFAILTKPAPALVFAALALAILLANTSLWANMFRAKEREDVRKHEAEVVSTESR